MHQNSHEKTNIGDFIITHEGENGKLHNGENALDV